MKLNGNSNHTLLRNKVNGNRSHNHDSHENHDNGYDYFGDHHVASSTDTPMRDDAFAVSDEIKQELIEEHFEQILNVLGLDLTDDSLRGTPKRLAKMYVKEIFKGLNPDEMPGVSVFDNKFQYGHMLVEKHIKVSSTCEHHFQPITGKAHVAYISSGKVIGLSKINRIVDYFARRPQVQERLTVQILNKLKEVLNTEDVAVVIEAKHMCVSGRGIEDEGSTTLTAEYSGKFKDDNVREEFLKYVSLDLKR